MTTTTSATPIWANSSPTQPRSRKTGFTTDSVRSTVMSSAAMARSRTAPTPNSAQDQRRRKKRSSSHPQASSTIPR